MKNNVTIMSSVSEENMEQLENMAAELSKEYIAQSAEKANKNDDGAVPYRLWTVCGYF